MGFWDVMKKVALPAASLAAIPFTGGLSATGFMGTLAKNAPAIIGAAGSALSKGSQASANNRGAQLDATLTAEQINTNKYRDWYQMMVDRDTSERGWQTENRAAEGDAWKRLQQAAYTANSTGPKTGGFSPYTKAIAGPSDEVKAAAAALAQQKGDAITSGRFNTPRVMDAPAPYTPITLDPKLMKGSAWETLAGYAGGAMEGYGTAVSQKRPVPTGPPKHTFDPNDHVIWG